jgi:hypothetical protein
VLQNGDRDGERIRAGQAGERHAKRAARDDKTGPQSLKSEVRVRPIGCLSLGADDVDVPLHVFLLQHGGTHTPRPLPSAYRPVQHDACR